MGGYYISLAGQCIRSGVHLQDSPLDCSYQAPQSWGLPLQARIPRWFAIVLRDLPARDELLGFQHIVGRCCHHELPGSLSLRAFLVPL